MIPPRHSSSNQSCSNGFSTKPMASTFYEAQQASRSDFALMLEEQDCSESSFHSTMTVPEAASPLKTNADNDNHSSNAKSTERRVHFHTQEMLNDLNGNDSMSSLEQDFVIEYHQDDDQPNHFFYEDQVPNLWYTKSEYQFFRSTVLLQIEEAQELECVMMMLHPNSAYGSVLENAWRACQYMDGPHQSLPLEEQAALERLFEEDDNVAETDCISSDDSATSCSSTSDDERDYHDDDQEEGVNPHWYRIGLEKYILTDSVGRDLVETRQGLNRLMERLQDDFVWTSTAEQERAMAKACQQKTRPFAVWAHCRAKALWEASQ